MSICSPWFFSAHSCKAEVRTILNKAVATGSIKPRLEVNIKPQVSGVIDELYVEAGANVELARIRVREAERELTRQSEVNSSQLDVKEAARSLEVAKKEEERNRQLLDDGIISEQDYLQFKLDLDLSQNAYDNAALLSSNNLGQVKAQLDIRKQELDAAENNLQLLREGRTNRST